MTASHQHTPREQGPVVAEGKEDFEARTDDLVGSRRIVTVSFSFDDFEAVIDDKSSDKQKLNMAQRAYVAREWQRYLKDRADGTSGEYQHYRTAIEDAANEFDILGGAAYAQALYKSSEELALSVLRDELETRAEFKSLNQHHGIVETLVALDRALDPEISRLPDSLSKKAFQLLGAHPERFSKWYFLAEWRAWYYDSFEDWIAHFISPHDEVGASKGCTSASSVASTVPSQADVDDEYKESYTPPVSEDDSPKRRSSSHLRTPPTTNSDRPQNPP
mgnify:CR=1 FL=1